MNRFGRPAPDFSIWSHVIPERGALASHSGPCSCPHDGRGRARARGRRGRERARRSRCPAASGSGGGSCRRRRPPAPLPLEQLMSAGAVKGRWGARAEGPLSSLRAPVPERRRQQRLTRLMWRAREPAAKTTKYIYTPLRWFLNLDKVMLSSAGQLTNPDHVSYS